MRFLVFSRDLGIVRSRSSARVGVLVSRFQCQSDGCVLHCSTRRRCGFQIEMSVICIAFFFYRGRAYRGSARALMSRGHPCRPVAGERLGPARTESARRDLKTRLPRCPQYDVGYLPSPQYSQETSLHTSNSWNPTPGIPATAAQRREEVRIQFT